VRTIEDLVPTYVQVADLREEYSRLNALQVHMAPKAGVITRDMFYLWIEEILGDCEDYDFKDSIEALIDAANNEDDSSSDGGSKPGNAAEDLSLGAEVGDLLRQYQQSEAATREKVTRDKALEMPKDGDTAHNKEDATDNRPEESSKPEHEASDSTPGPSKPTAAGLKTEEEIVSVSEEELLSESRQNLADTIFVVGASEGTGSLDAATLLEAVKSCPPSAEWDVCASSLEQAAEETFGLCKADFYYWVAEMFSEVDDERFEACALELQTALTLASQPRQESEAVAPESQCGRDEGETPDNVCSAVGDILTAPPKLDEAPCGSQEDAVNNTCSKPEELDVPASEPQVDSEYPDYQRTLKEAETTDFTAIMRMGFLHVVKDEALGQPVVVILARNINLEDIDVNLGLKFIVWMLDTIADSKFAVIYLNAEATMDNIPPISWMSEVNSTLPRKYRKNITAFYIVEPSMMLKTTIGIMTPFISRKFWKKLTFVDSISELFHQDSKVGFCCHHLLQWKREGK